MTEPEHHRVVIVGAGFGGIGASIKLAAEGVEHVILEKSDEVGGTWWANRYPGCRCDVPSHLYSFSFALNPDWSDSYSLQPEIWRYLRKVAEEHGVVERVRFGCKVDSARWDDAGKRWRLETSEGPISGDVLIAANGFLSEPAIPHFDGIENFAGEVMHSAQWDPSYDVTGKRVAIIGTGASAVQIVPRVHEDAEHLFVFQRTAAWILPHRGRPIRDWERALYRRAPLAQRRLSEDELATARLDLGAQARADRHAADQPARQGDAVQRGRRRRRLAHLRQHALRAARQLLDRPALGAHHRLAFRARAVLRPGEADARRRAEPAAHTR